jgi:stress response protein YsnF
MAIHDDDAAALERAVVIGGGGEKLGTVDGIYYDNTTDEPSWAAVKSGLFGHNVSLVPLAAASVHDGELHVPFDKERLGNAPHHDPERELSPQDEIDLFRHYGVAYDTGSDTTPVADPVPDATTPVTDRVADLGDDAMTRSEERLRVHTETQAVGRVRLRKHIVTEYKQITVPVRREEIRVERVPIGETDPPASDDAGIVDAGTVPTGSGGGHAVPDVGSAVDGDDEQEIILYEERPVVRTETVAVERVRVGKRTVTEQETVGGEVRREEIELDTDAGTDPR